MKTFVFSLILFALMLFCIAINYFYINRLADELLVMVAEAPRIDFEGCYSALSKIDDYWEAERGIAHLSVNYAELNRISDAISSMKAFAAASNGSEYENARQLLLGAIQKMRRLESFRLSNIF